MDEESPNEVTKQDAESTSDDEDKIIKREDTILDNTTFKKILDILDTLFKDDYLYVSSAENGVYYTCNSKFKDKFPEISRRDLLKFILFTSHLFNVMQDGTLQDFQLEFKQEYREQVEELYNIIKNHENTSLLLFRYSREGNSPLQTVTLHRKTIHTNLETTPIDANYFDITLPYEDVNGRIRNFRLEVDQIELKNLTERFNRILKELGDEEE